MHSALYVHLISLTILGELQLLQKDSSVGSSKTEPPVESVGL
ncbi:uncharacterized protein RAG0_10879 [Rhynchosporium agropyri]|uniref:Uncharacterized protein n=1 Tax=Rhynchosporium agropyri TaxID=914238 RepID=A0A1E1L1K0_9HELO|nr:uncharacterized protein RAG0_10879 [Rhynchosporium agropyri]